MRGEVVDGNVSSHGRRAEVAIGHLVLIDFKRHWVLLPLAGQHPDQAP